MTDAEVMCPHLLTVAKELISELKITAQFPETEFHPYFPVFAAIFRHECTNYDEVLHGLPQSFDPELAAAHDEPPGEWFVICSCWTDEQRSDDLECLNRSKAHDWLKSAAGELGQSIYDRLRILPGMGVNKE